MLNNVLCSMQVPVFASSSTASISEIDHIAEKYFEQIGSTEYNISILISNLFILAIVFWVQYKIYFTVADINERDKKLIKKYKAYVFRHVSLDYIFANLVNFLCIISVHSNINMIWNFLIAPFIGFITSIWFDNDILSKFEFKYDSLKNPVLKSKFSNNSNKSSENHEAINININNGTASIEDKQNDKKEDVFVLKGNDVSDKEKIEHTFNKIIQRQKKSAEEQKNLSEILEKHGKELNNQSQILNAVQVLMKNMIRFELEDMIYAALDKGYVTPAQDKRIRVKYKDYRANKGNGEIQELYEKRYLRLHIHEDKD